MAVHINTSKAFQPPRKAEEWNKYAHNLIKAMHCCLAALYENVEDFSDSRTVTEAGEDTALPDAASVPAIAETFSRHCHCLDLLLSTPTNWCVKLPMNAVINVLARCLRVTSADVKVKPSLSELAEVLPNLHQSSHKVMTRLIICCGSNVLPQSRIIVDVCLQSLAGAKHLKGESKCSTRASAFQVLCLMVTKFGWGKYLQSLSRLLIQELISDICLQESSKTDSTVNVAKQIQEVELSAQRKSKKKKKGKKLKGDSYKDLPMAMPDDGEGNAQKPELFIAKAAQQALNLSHLIMQRAEYSQSQVQALVRSVLDTSKTLQREGPSDTSPYKSEDCRKELYSTVFACATVKLGTDSNWKDTISHFQVTNLALSLLTRASQSETLDIQKTCSEFLLTLTNTGNLNRPIVRKIMPDEQRATKDVHEVEREVERLEEENKSLWKQLVDAQLELETQRKELKHLNQEAALTKQDLKIFDENKNSSNEENRTFTDDVATILKEDEGQSSEDEENLFDQDKIDLKGTDGMTSVINRGEEASCPAHDTLNNITGPSMNSSDEFDSPSTTFSANGQKKRVLNDKADKTVNNKRAKTDEPKATESDDIDAMISDFVDAAPDKD